MILFGSRAAGDHRDDPDVDIIVVADHQNHQASGARAEQVALDYMGKNPPEMELGIISMTRREFDRCRRVNQRIAGQAVNHGINMSSERLDYRYNYDNKYRSHWPTTKQKIQTAETKMMELKADVENDHWNQARTGEEAEMALENAMKGMLSAHDEWGRYRHDIPRAWRKINEVESWETPEEEEVRKSVQDLMEHTTFPAPVPGYPELAGPVRDRIRLLKRILLHVAGRTVRPGGKNHPGSREPRLAHSHKKPHHGGGCIARRYPPVGETSQIRGDEDQMPEENPQTSRYEERTLQAADN